MLAQPASAAGAQGREPRAREGRRQRLELGGELARRRACGGVGVHRPRDELAQLGGRARQQLLSRVWGYDYDPGSNVVDVYVGYLRRKLGADVLETVRGMGYRLAA